MTSRDQRPTLSIVVPVFNEEEALPRFFSALIEVLDEACPDAEILFVNDGSSDNTAEVLSTLQEADDRVVVVDLSRNFGHQAALTAGLDVACGEAVLTMDADLEHPPEAIPEFLNRWRDGAEVVFGIRRTEQQAGLFKRSSSRLFYWLFGRVSDVDIATASPDYRLMDHRAVEALRSMRERARFLRGMARWIGFRTSTVEFEPGQRAGGSSGYSAVKMIRFGVDGLLSFSKVPIRLTTLLGAAVSIGAFGYAGYAIYQLMAGHTVAGWTSIVVVLSFLSGVQLLALGMVGEYVGQVYDEVKQRPIYIIRDVARRSRAPRDDES
jgi:dolichol-phosphate mannosyltransferase